MALLLPQKIEDQNVYKKHTVGRGHGLFASQDLHLRSQIMLVARPLLMALDTAQLKSYCDCCFISAVDTVLSPDSGGVQTLKRCTGCRVLRFCSKVGMELSGLSTGTTRMLTRTQECQRRAWSQYHKLECKIYAAQPGVLPTLNRAILRLLKQQDTGIIPGGEWEELLTLQDHFEEHMQVGGRRWQDLLLMAKKLQVDSGGKRNLETILRLVCLVSAYLQSTSPRS